MRGYTRDLPCRNKLKQGSIRSMRSKEEKGLVEKEDRGGGERKFLREIPSLAFPCWMDYSDGFILFLSSYSSHPLQR